MGKNILLVNDLPGYGKVALSAMIPTLSLCGHHVSSLPTALVSNTLDYGMFEIQEETEYMEKTIKVWELLGFSFDYICTGFLGSGRQAEILIQYKNKHPDTWMLVDPIMGDDGKFYNGVSHDILEAMRKLTAHADLLIPNATEAALLVYGCVLNTMKDRTYYLRLISELRKLGAKSVVITSAVCNEQHCVFGYDAAIDQNFDFAYTHIPLQLPGTGDIFASILVDEISKNRSLMNSAMSASGYVYQTILKSNAAFF